MKRIVSVITSMIVALCAAAPFSYAEENRFTTDAGGNAATAEYATREQAVAAFVRAVGMDTIKADPNVMNEFLDSTKISFSLYDDMTAAVFSGLISGYEDNTLRPQDPISRVEALVVLSRALSRTELPEIYDINFSDVPAWASRQIGRLAAAGIVKGYGDGTIGSEDMMTPKQVDDLCNRIIRVKGPMGDFYSYVNKGWLDGTENEGMIASDMTRLTGEISSRITDIIFSLYRRCYNDGEEFASDSAEARIITVYSAAADQGYRDKTGLDPIKPTLGLIERIKTSEELFDAIADLEKSGFPTLVSVGLDTNPYNSAEYMPNISVGYLGVDPTLAKDREYNEAYCRYMEKLFIISGESTDSAKRSASTATRICRRLALAESSTKTGTELLLSAVIYSGEEIKAKLPHINMAKIFSMLGINKVDDVILYDMEPLVEADRIVAESSIEELKAYLKACVLDASARYLTSEMFYAYRDYLSEIYSTPLDIIPADYAKDIVEELLGWELGKLYTDIYFPETVKSAIIDMTTNLINEYKLLIAGSTRMSDKSREAAIKKLNNMTVNAAYPDDFEDYFSTEIVLNPIERGGNLIEYKTAFAGAYSTSCAALLNSGAKAGRGVWYLLPQTVNAMYDARSNSITIPAGILQPPFYDQTALYEENLGAIGTVIAHEISHAFDSKGAKFNENGNLSEQWTTGDYAAFKELSDKIVNEYDGIKVGYGTVNGSLTLDENMADIAGMACVLSLAGADNPNLDKLFGAYAKMWRTKTAEGYGAVSLMTDVHAPAEVRVNRVLANFNEFADLYGVIEGDGMYLPPESKINVWE